MAKLDIITLPDPLLRQISQPIEQVDDALRKLMDDMLETMHVAPGIGLAAIQVAVPKRLIVVDVGREAAEVGQNLTGAAKPGRKDGRRNGEAAVQPAAASGALENDEEPDDKTPREPNPICMVNPEILTLGDNIASYEEGCLSLPDVLVDIERPTSLSLRYIDRDGKQQILQADGLLATVIQHEIDHLNGRLIIDFLSRLKRDMVIRKFKKLKRSTGKQ